MRSMIIVAAALLAPLTAAAQTPSDSIPLEERIEAVNTVLANRSGILRDSTRIDTCALLSVLSNDPAALRELYPIVRAGISPEPTACTRTGGPENPSGVWWSVWRIEREGPAKMIVRARRWSGALSHFEEHRLRRRMDAVGWGPWFADEIRLHDFVRY